MQPEWYVGLGTLITLVIGAVVAGIVQITKVRHDNSRELRQDTIDEMQALITRLTKDYEDSKLEIRQNQEEIRALQTEARQCERQYERAISRIEYLEEMMAGKGFPVRPFNKDGSDLHRSLPPEADKSHG